MNNEPRLVKFLKTLNKEELMSIDKYVIAIQGKNNDCYLLFAFLVKHCENSELNFDATYLHKHVLPHSTIKSISNYLSLLKNSCEDWFVLNTIKKDKLKYQNILLEGYLQKELHDFADQQVLKLNDIISKDNGFNIEKKLAKAKMNHHLYYSDHPFKNNHKGEAMNMVMLSYFDAIIHELLLYQIELKNWGKIQTEKYEKWYKIIKKVANQINTKEAQFIKSLADIQDNPTVEKLKNLDDTFSNGIVDIKSKFYIDATDYLRLAGIRLFRQQQDVDRNFTFSKYVQRLHYMEENSLRISSAMLINITGQLSVIYSYDQIKEFIEKWIFLTNPGDRKVTLLRCNALNCLYHERYGQMSEYILGKEFKKIDDKVTVTILLLIALYMTDEKGMAEIKLKNFNYFLKRNIKELGINKAKRYINFAKFYSYMLRNDKHNAEKCLQEEISYRIWCNKII